MTSLDTALFIVRVWIGVVMLLHGLHHARSLDGTAKWFESKGFRNARIQALMSVGGEIAIGIGMVFGLFTAFAAAGLIATVMIAFWSIHRFAGFFVFNRPDEGYEYVATLAVGAMLLALAGPGALSLDEQLGLAPRFDGRMGFAIVAAGVLVGVLQLATTWRRPMIEDELETGTHT